MKFYKSRYSDKCGFTLVEVLVSLSIITILVGILIPSLNYAYEKALETKQKMQLAGIGLALEAFMSASGYGDYPPSNENMYDGISQSSFLRFTGGSQKLSEALIGLDAFGWHPDSVFATAGYENLDGSGLHLYHPTVFDEYTPTQADTNFRQRNKPYLEVEKVNAVPLKDIYSGIMETDLRECYVLTDVYGTVKSNSTGKKIGMPILYYRANTAGIYHEISTVPGAMGYYNALTRNNPNHIYEYADNLSILDLGHPENGSHPMASDMIWFYNNTTNPNTTNPARPYNAQGFILQSAGPDGLYGTVDDVFNF